MPKLFVTAEARKDIEDLWKTSPQAAARISVFLQELSASQRLLELLLVHDYGALQDTEFSVSKILSLWNTLKTKAGRDLWRLKLWDLEKQGLPYRVIYAYEIRRQRYHVLGIINRKDFNYEPEHPFTKRILRAYDDVCG